MYLVEAAQGDKKDQTDPKKTSQAFMRYVCNRCQLAQQPIKPEDPQGERDDGQIRNRLNAEHFDRRDERKIGDAP